MTIRKNNSHSLIPYLDPENSKFHLKISLRFEGPAVLEKRIDPFMVITESGPYARIIEAQFMTNAGSEIKRVFLLLQKDEYHFAKDELRPIGNKDIDQCWQEAFSLHSGKEQDDSVILLSGQTGKEGELLPFQSLFFCKSRHVFFHPLCPKCGSALQQCYDDALLKGIGLLPYSTSTRRYLFCPACYDSEKQPDFYAVSLESTDPPILKDCSDLVKAFGNIAEDWEHPGQFPCKGCPTRMECYGDDDLAVSRIVPFSFYPFYMFIFDAMSVNAVDFLALGSGASFEELETHLAGKQETGRIKCLEDLKRRCPERTPFFFDKDERYFLEVLYLKLSFLGELVQTIFPELDNFNYPDMGISIDRIWIKLADQGGLLPFFWDFKVRLVDMVGSAVKTTSFPKMSPSYDFHFLGLVWFYTLLANKRQDISAAYGVLGQAMEETASGDGSRPGSSFITGDNPVFSPENIFWDPDVRKQRPVPGIWKPLWEKSLGLGWSLLRAGLGGGTEWSKDGFLEDLAILREDIKENLFRQMAPVVQAEPAQESRDIHNILAGIMEKWTMDLEAKKDVSDETVVMTPSSDSIPGPPKEMVQDEVIAEQTVILTADRLEKEAAPPIQEEGLDKTVILAPPSGDTPAPSGGVPRDDGDVSQTVILRTQDLAEEPGFPVQEEDGLDKTVVLPPGSGQAPGSPEAVPEDHTDVGDTVPISPGVTEKEPAVQEEAGLDETVILSPGGLDKQTRPPVQEEAGLDATVIISPKGPSEKEQPPARTQEDDIPETVVIRPSEPEKESPGPSPQGPPEDEALDETVILRPGKGREGE